MQTLKPENVPMYPTADSLQSAMLMMQAALCVDNDELLPALMVYHNTLVKELQHADGSHLTTH